MKNHEKCDSLQIGIYIRMKTNKFYGSILIKKIIQFLAFAGPPPNTQQQHTTQNHHQTYQQHQMHPAMHQQLHHPAAAAAMFTP